MRKKKTDVIEKETKSSKKAGKRRGLLAVKVVLAVALAGMLGGYVYLTTTGHANYTIEDGASTTVLRSSADSVEDVLAQAGITIGPEDEVTAEEAEGITRISIRRKHNVTVRLDGNSLDTSSYDGTVSQLLDSLEITLNEQDVMVSEGRVLSPDEKITDGMDIQITRNDIQTVTETSQIPYETVTYLDPSLSPGERQVRTQGEAGTQETTLLERYVDGELTDTTVLSRRLLSAPVTEVVVVGSGEAAGGGTERPEGGELPPEEAVTPPDEVAAIKAPGPSPSPEPEEKTEETEEDPAPAEKPAATPQPSPSSQPTPQPTPEPTPEPTPAPTPEPTPAPTPAPTPQPTPEPEPEPSGNTVTTSDGQVLSYSSVLTMEATAYTGGGTTATGTSARYGAIAVDPSVISYGTRMYIVTSDGKWVYGIATAEDCGGAIKGNIIDLYFDDYNTCIQFGRRSCTVYILD